MDDLYVDNAMLDAETTDEATEKYHQAKKLFGDAKMNLREFLSNNSKVSQAIKEDRQSGRIIKVLGIRWDTETDVLHIKLLNEDRGTESLIKRKIYALVAGIYDPMGLVSPMILSMKVFLQQLWQEKLSWDEELPSTNKIESERHLAGAEGPDFLIPRRYFREYGRLQIQTLQRTLPRLWFIYEVTMGKRCC
ncbi:unnamed protein product [Gongylonema pulchrum]|uniref:Reverse transcriptase domain-containing protein n=1 Tax=Gongylonema pulchrum TaxID=637853 RepID=A0A183E2W1_9BILA|nr:unnamed protein product [Gongylonema pulchrum]